MTYDKWGIPLGNPDHSSDKKDDFRRLYSIFEVKHELKTNTSTLNVFIG